LDDLLATSWVACQGTDVLIESPSAMGGYHIAEALGIPYFRAFTMTWSRTRYSGFICQRCQPLIYMYRRAYPHAFAVPERKVGNFNPEFTFLLITSPIQMGGSYNYMVNVPAIISDIISLPNFQSYVMFDQVFWRATSGQINRWRRNVLHLASTSLDKMEPHKIPFLYNFSPVVVPSPLDWPEWIRITGTCKFFHG
jgi:sterol 3beta-glucosyltransferase